MARHNEAGRHILKQILKGARGANAVYADVGNEAHLLAEGLDTATMWAWAQLRSLLTGRGRKRAHDEPAAGAAGPAPPLTEEEQLLAAAGRLGDAKRHSRPDMVLMSPAPCADGSAWRKHPRPRVTLVELKFCSDTQWQGARQRALAQHQALMHDIRAAHPNAQVELQVLLVGAVGSIYKEHTIKPLRTLGLDNQQISKLVRKLNVHAVQRAHDLVVHRRQHTRQHATATAG